MSEDNADPILSRMARLLGYYGVLVQGGSLAPDQHVRDELAAIEAELTRLRGEVLAAERRGAERALRWACTPQNLPDLSFQIEDDADVRIAEPWGVYVDRGLAALYPPPAPDTQGVGGE